MRENTHKVTSTGYVLPPSISHDRDDVGDDVIFDIILENLQYLLMFYHISCWYIQLWGTTLS